MAPDDADESSVGCGVTPSDGLGLGAGDADGAVDGLVTGFLPRASIRVAVSTSPMCVPVTVMPKPAAMSANVLSAPLTTIRAVAGTQSDEFA
jgi:hypothetical protein